MKRSPLSFGLMVCLLIAPVRGQETVADKPPPVAEPSLAPKAAKLPFGSSRARPGRLRVEAYAKQNSRTVRLADCGRTAPRACPAEEAIVVDNAIEGSCIGKTVPTSLFVIADGPPFPGVPVRMKLRSEGVEPVTYAAVIRLASTLPQPICVEQSPRFGDAPLEVAISPLPISLSNGDGLGEALSHLTGSLLGGTATGDRDAQRLGAFGRILDKPNFSGGISRDPIFGQSTSSPVKLSVSSRAGSVPIFHGRDRVGTTSDSFYIAANVLSEIVVGPPGRGKPLMRCEKSDAQPYSFTC